MDDWDKTTNMALEEMFRRVGIAYPNDITKKDRWYELVEWTAEEQDDFAEWMHALIKKRHPFYKVYRPEVMELKIREQVDMFLMMWGWKTKP